MILDLLVKAPSVVTEYEDKLLTLRAQLEYRTLAIRAPVRDEEELAYVERWIATSHDYLVKNAELYNKCKLLLGVPQERITEILNQIKELNNE